MRSLLVPSQEGNNVALCAWLTGLGGMQYGYSVGVIGSAVTSLEKEFQVTSTTVSLLSSATLVGAVVGSPTSGVVNDAWGRVRATQLGETCNIAGSIMVLWTRSLEGLALSRFLVGFGVGFCTLAKPLYVRETVDDGRTRAAILGSFPVFVGVGLFLAHVAADVVETWQSLLLLGGIPAVIMLILASTIMTESSAWLSDRLPRERRRRPETPRRRRDPPSTIPGQVAWAVGSGVILAAGNQLTSNYPTQVYTRNILGRANARHVESWTLGLSYANLVSAVAAVLALGASKRRIALIVACSNLVGAACLLVFALGANVVGLLGKTLVHQLGPGAGYFILVLDLTPFAPRDATLVYSVANTARYFFEFSQAFAFLPALNAFGLRAVFLFFATVSILCGLHAFAIR